MENIPKISDAEWQVMKVLWEKSPITANEIIARLEDEQSWKPKTIRTLINRLVGKNAVGFDKDGRQYLYYPLLPEADCVRDEARSFFGRMRAGVLKPMLAAFIEQQKLSKDEIEELKRMLDR
ncbi:MAG: BlaI/MecI/CopY family transcriptional regulator [Sedimentisphaerales bacterium]|nr:BlaI/MecI/CopY family transcriptional regulator [Sedimentisphaerales bacterium]MBN2842125.1 BlaI/MecI/CopY family transcriptional regulator [Sedimentisphaerales bacterium]